MIKKFRFTIMKDGEPSIPTDEIVFRTFINGNGDFILDGCRVNSGNMPVRLCCISPRGHAWNYLEGFRDLGIEPNPSNQVIVSLKQKE